MPTDGVDMAPINDDIPITVIDATPKDSNKMTLQHLVCQATANENNDNLQKEAANACTFEKLLQQ